MWVGEKSKILNAGGIRSALVEAVRKIKHGAVRWPGGLLHRQLRLARRRGAARLAPAPDRFLD
ncbi:MAG: hypothetical protein M3362_24620 [Acidobacteriota bacterium]|nr:hypothetical protein [Acidobacteriota bacterium]